MLYTESDMISYLPMVHSEAHIQWHRDFLQTPEPPWPRMQQNYLSGLNKFKGGCYYYDTSCNIHVLSTCQAKKKESVNISYTIFIPVEILVSCAHCISKLIIWPSMFDAVLQYYGVCIMTKSRSLFTKHHTTFGHNDDVQWCSTCPGFNSIRWLVNIITLWYYVSEQAQLWKAWYYYYGTLIQWAFSTTHNFGHSLMHVGLH